MLCCRVPVGVRRLADRFKDLFYGQSASYSNLCAMYCFFLFGCTSLSEFVRRCPWSHSVSDLSRAVCVFDSNRFMRRLRASILRHYDGSIAPENFCFAVDDTANPKYGKSIYRCGSWVSSSGPYIVQKILVVSLVDIHRGIALPLGYVILPKRDDPEHVPAPKLAVRLLKDLLEQGLPKLPVVTDSWFDSTDFMDELENIGLTFAGEIKSNRNVRPSSSPTVAWRKLPKIFSKLPRTRVAARLKTGTASKGPKRTKHIAERWIYIRGRKRPIKTIAVYNRANSTKAFAYYATTDLAMAGEKLWQLSRARWRIECLFRDLKQNLSFGCLPCGGEKAADLAVCIPFLIIVSLRLDGAARWNLSKDAAIGTMIDQVREKELTRSIEIVTSRGGGPLRDRLLARRVLERINKKPVNRLAEAA